MSLKSVHGNRSSVPKVTESGKGLSSVLPDDIVGRFARWSEVLQMDVRVIEDIGVIRNNSLRARAEQGRLTSFYGRDDDTLYVIPRNLMNPPGGGVCTVSHTDRSVLNAVLSGGGLKRLVADPEEYRQLMLDIWRSRNVPPKYRNDMPMYLTGSPAGKFSYADAGNALLDLMSGMASKYCMPFVKDMHRAVMHSPSLIRMGIHSGCIGGEDLWDHMIRFYYFLEQERIIKSKDIAELQADMFDKMQNCARSGYAHGEMLELGMTSPELQKAGFSSSRIRVEAPRFLSKMLQHKYTMSDLRQMDFIEHLQHPLCVMPTWSRDENSAGRVAVYTDIVVEDRENDRYGVLCYILPSRQELRQRRAEGQNWIDLVSFHPRAINHMIDRLKECQLRGHWCLERNLYYVSPDFSRRLRRCVDDYNEKTMRIAGSDRFLLGDAHLIDIANVVDKIGKAKFSDKKDMKAEPVVREPVVSTTGGSCTLQGEAVAAGDVEKGRVLDRKFGPSDMGVAGVCDVLAGQNVSSCRDVLRKGRMFIVSLFSRKMKSAKASRSAVDAVDVYVDRCGMGKAYSGGMGKGGDVKKRREVKLCL